MQRCKRDVFKCLITLVLTNVHPDLEQGEVEACRHIKASGYQVMVSQRVGAKILMSSHSQNRPGGSTIFPQLCVNETIYKELTN
ncbi:hypothetical protein CB1_000961026 [Camelus ferus]|nr:hypothetical protein CB1_000961026 [Camelus ferus]